MQISFVLYILLLLLVYEGKFELFGIKLTDICCMANDGTEYGIINKITDQNKILK